jgi:2-(1,2-epoxy-1,2-dihydrophenyl)acetyl-CoA isomerase
VTDAVATITLNRPDTMNALNTAMKEKFRERVRQAAEDPGVRAVVLTGSGRAFCAGQDLKEHSEMLDQASQHQEGRLLGDTIHDHYNPTVHALLTMPKPVVAAVNGLAIGAGMSFACACDLRTVAESAAFNVAFASVGLSCDTGMSWTLPRLVGWGKARELLLFPRKITAAEALELGLATEVVPDSELASRTQQLATELANGPTVAYGAIKSALAVSASASLDEALKHEGVMMMRAGQTSDHREAVRAFVAKQKPEFHGQ